MLGTIMFLSKLLMEFLPNIHLVATLIVAYTLVYRVKALIPIYVFVLLAGIYGSFNAWWVPYIYIWTILWGLIMLIPKGLNPKIALVLYTGISALFGLFFGVLYAPAQAIMLGYNLQETLAWIAAGLYFDIAHFVGNLVLGFLIYPLSRLLTRLSRQIGII